MEKIKELLGDDLFTQVVNKLDGAKLMIDNDNFIPLVKFNQINERMKVAESSLVTQKETFETQLSTVNESLKEFENVSKLTKEQTERISNLTKSNDQMKSDYDIKIKEQQLDHQIDLKLIEVGARNVTSVKAHIKMDKISSDNGNLLGFDDQMEIIKKEHDYLFGEIKKVSESPENGISPKPVTALQKDYETVKEKFGAASRQAIYAKQQMYSKE